MDEESARRILGVQGELTEEKITTPWKEKISKVHPDRGNGGDEELSKKLNDARDTLKEALKRRSEGTSRSQNENSKTGRPTGRSSKSNHSSKGPKAKSNHGNDDSASQAGDPHGSTPPRHLCSVCFVGNLQAMLETPGILDCPLDVRSFLYNLRNLLNPSKLSFSRYAKFPGEKACLVSEGLIRDLLRNRNLSSLSEEAIWKILVEVFGRTSLVVCTHRSNSTPLW